MVEPGAAGLAAIAGPRMSTGALRTPPSEPWSIIQLDDGPHVALP